MSCLFGKCLSIKSIPDISNWITKEVRDMAGLFYQCISLNELPDISKWDTNNVYFMMSMFYGCEALTSLPDISKWKTDRVVNISLMFCGCRLLETIPDISKWNIYNNKTEINFLKHELLEYKDVGIKEIGELLASFQIDYSEKCNINYLDLFIGTPADIKDLEALKKYLENNIFYSLFALFAGCSALKALPDISKWNVGKVKHFNNLFYGCSSLTSLPDISKWDLNNAEQLYSIFYGCGSLITLPDISNWKTENVENIKELFYIFYIFCFPI